MQSYKLTPQSQPPESEYRFAVMLWIVMLISLGMYFVVIRVVRPEQPVDNPTLVYVLLALAVASAAASFGAKAWFQSRARNENRPVFRRTGFIIALVLCETAALYGVVAWFLTESTQSYLFLVIAGLAMLLHFPARTT